MRASGVIKLEVTADLASGFADRLVGMQVDVLVFERTPEALDEDVVGPAALAIHADLDAFSDTVRHHLLLEKVARRINDGEVMRLLKLMLTASGKQGVPQGGVISPLLSNIYLTEMDQMLERAKETTRNGKYAYVEYARFADDLVVLIDAHPRNAWLLGAVNKRLREEFAKLQVEINEEKSRIVDLDAQKVSAFWGSISDACAVWKGRCGERTIRRK